MSLTSLGWLAFFTRRRARSQATSPTGRTARDIEIWSIQRLSERKKVDPDSIDVRAPLATFEIDSRAAVELAGELEDWLGVKLAPTILWDYPTIESLARALGDDGQWQ
jgi:acyl carrier protein